MSYTVKILIPLGLGVVAAILNLMVLRGATQPVEFVQVTQDIDFGKPFTSDVLAKLQLPSQFSHLKATAVPYSDMGILIDQPAQRKLVKGDIVFLRDIAVLKDRMELRDDESAFPVSLNGIEVPAVVLQIGKELDFRLKPDA